MRITIIGILVFLFFWSCTTISKVNPYVYEIEVENYQLPFIPETGKAMIYIVQPALDSEVHSITIYLDSIQAANNIGATRNSTYLAIEINPGKHELFIYNKYWNSKVINIASGEILFLKQAQENIGFSKNDMLQTIDLIEGKYWVKKLENVYAQPVRIVSQYPENHLNYELTKNDYNSTWAGYSGIGWINSVLAQTAVIGFESKQRIFSCFFINFGNHSFIMIDQEKAFGFYNLGCSIHLLSNHVLDPYAELDIVWGVPFGFDLSATAGFAVYFHPFFGLDVRAKTLLYNYFTRNSMLMLQLGLIVRN